MIVEQESRLSKRDYSLNQARKISPKMLHSLNSNRTESLYGRLAQESEMGKIPKGPKPGKSVLRRLYVKDSKSIREIAEALGCTKDMVHRSLQEYGIEIRTNKRRSSLVKYKLSELYKGVKAKGVRGYARELGVDESTLRHHLKVRKG